MGLVEIDTSLFFLINKGMQSAFLDVLMPFASNNMKYLFLLPALLLVLRERSKALAVLVMALVAVAIADSSGNLLKGLVARERPCVALHDVRLLVGLGPSYSLPSNHASNSFAVAISLLLLGRNAAGILSLVIAAVVGISRVYVGVHYPFDVAAGALLGGVAALLSIRLYAWAEKIYRSRSYAQALYLVILVMSFFRIYYILTGPFDLSPDEAHYWEWSRRLDWSYYSKGPMIAYLIHSGTAIFGNNVLGVRFFAVALSALGSMILYTLGKELRDERTGFVSALLLQVVPLYSVFGIIFTIDSPFIFFWILSLFLFRRAVCLSGEARSCGDAEDKISALRKSALIYWILAGASVGLGLLAKYTMAFFFLSAFLFMVSRKETRRNLFEKGPYIALLISAVVFSPVVFWNARNGWVSVRHTAGQAHLSDGLRLSMGNFFEFLGSQIGVITPVLAVMICMAVWKMRKEKEGPFLLWFSAPVILFFLLKSMQGKVQANWALAGYATAFIAFSLCYASEAAFSKKTVRVFVYSAISIALFVTVLAHLPAVPGLPFEKNPSKRLAGWKVLGREVSLAYEGISSSSPAFIFSDSYQVASELAFYMKGNPITYCVNLGRRMNQYDLWPGFENFTGYNAVFVVKDDWWDLPEPLVLAFARHEKIPLPIRTKSGYIVKFTLFKCYDFRGIKTRQAETY